MRTSIVIPTLSHLEDCLRPCLTSIAKNTDLSQVEILVVSNGSTDGTDDYVRSLGEPFKLLTFPRPLGYTHATNVGIQAAKGDVILLLNNDSVILDFQNKHEWIERLCEPFQDPSVGITGPLMLHDGTTDRDFLVFMCVAIRRDMFDKIGLLDETFSPGGGEDLDFCFKMEQLGYRMVCVSQTKGVDQEHGLVITNFPIYHKGEATMMDAEHKPGWQAVLDRNMKILADQYNLPLGAFWDGDIREYQYLVNEVPNGGTICELGTLVGRSLCSVAYLVKRKSLSVIAVDTYEGTVGDEAMRQLKQTIDFETEFRKNVTRFGLNPTIHRMLTDDAAKLVPDHSLDLCFIDADHSYESVKRDIETWEPKLKPGGVIGGHDYYGTAWPGVTRAVHERYRDIRHTWRFGETWPGCYIWSKKL